MSLYNLHHNPEYPKRKYAPSGGSVTVANATEERALGLGWSDNDPTPTPAAEPDAKPAKKGKKE